MRRHDQSIERAIKAALATASRSTEILYLRDLSGGCIHQVVEIELSDGQKLVAKLNSSSQKTVFDEECAGLTALQRTNTVVTPVPLACVADDSYAVLLMRRIEPPGGQANSKVMWERFGRDLAALHQVDAGSRYGFDANNHIGSTVQPNEWCNDWVEFNQVHRLGFQLKLLRDRRHVSTSQARMIQTMIDRLDQILPRRPKPSLLHGDLWSGNVIPTSRDDGSGTCAVIDPACSIGDGWADIAMMKLFGGFDRACFDSYGEIHNEPEYLPERILGYQLYHVLNHANIFGGGYVEQAVTLARQLGG
jgi:protein-ribulosamine 3-kinase